MPNNIELIKYTPQTIPSAYKAYLHTNCTSKTVETFIHQSYLSRELKKAHHVIVALVPREDAGMCNGERKTRSSDTKRCVIGFALLREVNGGNDLYLQLVCSRSPGVGKLLISKIEETAKTLPKVNRITLHAIDNKGLWRWYESKGFNKGYCTNPRQKRNKAVWIGDEYVMSKCLR